MYKWLSLYISDVLFLLNMIRDDWLRPKAPNERNVMIKRARIARILTIFGYFVMLMSVVFALFLPVFGVSLRYRTNRTDPDRLLPLQTYYIYDKNKSPFFEITYIAQCIALSLAAAMYTSTDCFLSSLIFHVCGQLQNLKNRMIDLDKFHDFGNALSYNIQDHVRLIR